MPDRMEHNMPRIGDPAPRFSAESTQGPVQFPEDYAGRWVLFFSHPADFTPVCTTEFMTLAAMAEEFRAMHTELLGLSVDSLYAHIAWLRKIEELEWNGMQHVQVNFPLIADVRMEIAQQYGMMHPGQSDTQAVRAVFVIDPEGIIRAMQYYPLTTGRSIGELKRLIQALQKADAQQVATPADWQKGQDVIIPAAGSCGAARDRVTKHTADQYCLDWFLCFQKEKED